MTSIGSLVKFCVDFTPTFRSANDTITHEYPDARQEAIPLLPGSGLIPCLKSFAIKGAISGFLISCQTKIASFFIVGLMITGDASSLAFIPPTSPQRGHGECGRGPIERDPVCTHMAVTIRCIQVQWYDHRELLQSNYQSNPT